MSSFVCIELDGTTCVEWAQTWSPPALSSADGVVLASAVLACWALAWGIRQVVNHINNRSS